MRIDVVELHDAFTSDCRPTGYRAPALRIRSRLCRIGLLSQKPADRQTRQLPSNLSGGLIGCMHAVGASGIMQVFEIATQLWGRWAEIHGDEKRWEEFGRKKPEDWTDLQVEGAKRALSISHAGVGSHVTATVLMDPDHLLKKDS